ncbi:MAG: hypothetical protein ACP5NS_03600 [Candidatus Pacearchaeota archaeon]
MGLNNLFDSFLLWASSSLDCGAPHCDEQRSRRAHLGIEHIFDYLD